MENKQKQDQTFDAPMINKGWLMSIDEALERSRAILEGLDISIKRAHSQSQVRKLREKRANLLNQIQLVERGTIK